MGGGIITPEIEERLEDEEVDEIKDIITNKYNDEIMTLTNDEKNNFFVSTLSKIKFQNNDIGYIVDHLNGLGLEDIGVPSKIRIELEDPRDPSAGKECQNDEYDTQSDVDCNPDIGQVPQCMLDHIECMLKPYAGGDWKPPMPDCENFILESSIEKQIEYV